MKWLLSFSIIGISLFTIVIGVSYLHFTEQQIYVNFPAIRDIGNNSLIFSNSYDFTNFGGYAITGVLDFFFNLSSWFAPAMEIATTVLNEIPSVLQEWSQTILDDIFLPITNLWGNIFKGGIV